MPDPTRFLPPEERDRLLLLADSALLALCRAESMRGTGPGGQKRNVTDSAVRLTLPDLNLTVVCDATRSQGRNRIAAVRRLRRQIALQVRSPAGYEQPAYSDIPRGRSGERLVWLAHALDLLDAHAGRLSETARRLGCSTGRLVRELAREPDFWRRAGHIRRKHGLPLLRRPD